MLPENLASFDSEWCGCGCGFFLACYWQPVTTPVPFSTRALGGAEQWLNACKENGWAVAGHNIRSDFHTLGVYPEGLEVLDSLVLSWLHQENGSHKLKELAPRVLGRDLEDPITVKESLDENGRLVKTTYFKGVHIAEASIHEVERYCMADALATRDLALYYWNTLPNNLRSWYVEVEQPLDRVVFEMEQRGVRLDTDKMLQETLALRKLTAELREKLYAEVGYKFNLDSPQQVGKVLFAKEWQDKERGPVGIYKACRTHKKPLFWTTPAEYHGYRCGCEVEPKEGWVDVTRKGLGLKARKKTPTGQPAVDDEVLSHFTKYVVVQLLLEYRESEKVLGTYLEAFPRFMEGDRLYGHFNTTGTVTGRFSSSDPNLQNIPARGELGRRVRGLFIPQAGHLLVVADADQLELRLLASFCKDPALTAAFESGEDVHQTTADLMGVDRDLAKNVNYCETPDTRVLMEDLSWRPLGDIVPGDVVWGFDEEPSGERGRKGTRRWRKATVLNNDPAYLPCVCVVFSDGTERVVTGNHPWLARKNGARTYWAKAGELQPGDKVIRYLSPTEPEESWAAGWLTGMMDGEGYAGPNHIGISQVPGPLLNTLVTRSELLVGAGVKVYEGGTSPTHTVALTGGARRVVETLGRFPSRRMARNFGDRLEGKLLQSTETLTVVSVCPVGLRQVCRFGTSTRTYISEGLGSHNSIAYDASARTIQQKYAPNQSLAFIQAAMDKHRETFPMVYEWKDRVRRFARQHGFVYTIGMRKRHLPDIRSFDQRMRHRAERQAVNCVIQGSAADIFRKAMVKLEGLPLLLQVHDELVFEAPEHEAAFVANAVIQALQGAAKDLGVKVPITCSPHSAPSWAAAKGKEEVKQAA